MYYCLFGAIVMKANSIYLLLYLHIIAHRRPILYRNYLRTNFADVVICFRL